MPPEDLTPEEREIVEAYYSGESAGGDSYANLVLRLLAQVERMEKALKERP